MGRVRFPTDPLSEILTLNVFGPSGSGKTSVIEELCRRDPMGCRRGITTTTRPPRENEVDGVDYHFVSVDAFKRLLQRDEFLEYAKVYDHWYGTQKEELGKVFHLGGYVLILNIDRQGARQIQSRIPGAVVVQLLVKSRQELEKRLRTRGTDKPEVIARRLAGAREEIAAYPMATHVVMNDDLAEAVDEVTAIVRAELARRPHQAANVEALLREWDTALTDPLEG